MQKYLLLLLIFSSTLILKAQSNTWAVAIGGSQDNTLYQIIQSSDGGFVLTGEMDTYPLGKEFVFISKLDSNGNMQWGNTIGGSGGEFSSSIVETNDKGYIAVGGTGYGSSYGDIYLIRVDSSGNLIWTKAIGGYAQQQGESIIKTSDNGYAIGGIANFSIAGPWDFYMIKMDSSCNVEWTRTIGGTGNEQASQIIQTKDKGYAIAGETDSYGAGGYDVYFVKLDSLGNLQWTKTIGGRKMDWCVSVVQCNDGGFAMTGCTYSYLDSNSGDVYVAKIDSIGNLMWSRTIGGVGIDEGISIIEAKNKELVVTGFTTSFGAGSWDVYFIRLDPNGNLKQTRTFGTLQDDRGASVIQAKNGNFVIGGTSQGLRGYLNDFFVLEIDTNGISCDTTGYGGIIDSGGIAGTGGSITSMNNTIVDSGGAESSFGVLTPMCGITTSSLNVKHFSGLEIFPNPCSNTLFISIENQISSKNECYLITDVYGRCLLSNNLPFNTINQTIDVSTLAQGMYFIKIISENQVVVKKFIKL